MEKCTQQNLYTIPAHQPFARELVRHLLHETADQPERLTQYRVLLPTRRACRIVRETFLNMNNGKPLLLPQLTPLGDVDEEDLSLLMFGSSDAFLDIPSVISPMRRQFMLAKLIQKVPEFAQGPDHALALAAALGRFIDLVLIEGLDLADLHKIVPEEFAAHWQITLSFLQIISDQWPKIMAAHNVIEAAQRRNMLLEALAQHWQNNPPETPVIAAGSTGSIPAAAKVLKVIAGLENGRVIFPGLDLGLSEAAWDQVRESHPQFGFKMTLSRMDATRGDVQLLSEYASDHGQEREALASLMMLPAEETYRWKSAAQNHDVAAMIDGVEYYPCDTQQEEAGVIGLIMREALEDPTRVTALVTPDRQLAMRVRAVCRRYGIDVDDSAGEKLQDTRIGRFLRLSMEAACAPYDPHILLALLKTPLCRIGLADKPYKAFVQELEYHYLRTRLPITSFSMLHNRVAQNEKSVDLLEFLEGFRAAQGDLCCDAKRKPFKTFVVAHLKAMEALASREDKDGAELIWRGDAGEAAAMFFNEILEHADELGEVSSSDYVRIMVNLLRDVTVRSPYGVHPRLLILGQFEARLSRADTVIIGSLNEGVWPTESAHDPWMSRPMRAEFGLPATDQAVGIAAHDFVQNFCARRVIMTRAEKTDGGPSVPTRWLARLDSILQAAGKSLDDLSLHPYRTWQAMIDESDRFEAFQRPEPRPPASARPKGASVTKIETWLQNPYAIYMHYVLNLRPLDPLSQDNDAALRGNILHEILDRFVSANPADIKDNAEAEILDTARIVLNEMLENQEQIAYWWPKLVRITEWFVSHERDWRIDATFKTSEAWGSVDLEMGGAPFNLHGKVDRIDELRGGGYAVIDYKSSGEYTSSKMKKGEMPQLPLEAWMLKLGAFREGGVAAGKTGYLGYWKMTGGRQSGECIDITHDTDKAVEIVAQGLTDLVLAFRDERVPFYALPNMSNLPRFNDYAHVSREQEWITSGESEG